MILEGKLVKIGDDRLTFVAKDKTYRIDLVAMTKVMRRGRMSDRTALAVDQTLRITGPTAGWTTKVVTALQIDIVG
jgi:hypothetical protein